NMQRLATLDWYEVVAVANLEVPAYTYSDWSAGQLQKRVFIQKNAGSPELKVNNSSITQTAKVYREITYQVTKYPEATVLVPYQGVTFDGNLIVERNTDNIPASTLSNLYQFVAYENIWLDGIGLVKPFRVKMAYPDVDNDGIIDGTSELAESSLRIYNYSTTRGRWEPIFGQVVDRQNNIVSGWTADLGVFAVVGKYPDVPVITGQSARMKMDKGWAFCAIATAAYGTPFARDIDILRNFRDRRLLTNPIGRKYVYLYYKYSPPVAATIRQYPVLRYLTRQALQPIIATLKP
ncbi:MAG: hypothetical protein HY762_03130, partial [Planctomycetes bacterium]|nr:hypothetical protein [Planctomycetota bacterium]